MQNNNYWILKFALAMFCLISANHSFADIWLETESFSNKGGWVVDQEFMDQMGSPYLLAHGMGIPVADAATTVKLDKKGTYYIYVRTYNWTSPWYKGEGPGQFQLKVEGKLLPAKLGCSGDKWTWENAGTVKVSTKPITIALHDLTGFEGRCDAIYFAQKKISPSVLTEQLRENMRTDKTVEHQQFDFVVVGGGVAGMCAAVSAARQGLKVALINDRPAWGGNNSEEIRVPLQGEIHQKPYTKLGNLVDEFQPQKKIDVKRDMMSSDPFRQKEKSDWLTTEKNLSIFPSYRAFKVEKDGNNISSVTAQQIETGHRITFRANLFADCTGDGTIGYLAGADYDMGREARSEYHEYLAPEKRDSLMQGGTIQWNSEETDMPSDFPVFKYGLNINEENKLDTYYSMWYWESGNTNNPITEAEYTRDLQFLAVYSNWSFLKNESKEKVKFDKRHLTWMQYVLGKRESRRLLGDYILKETDITKDIVYPDATATATYAMDHHFPDPDNQKAFGKLSFKTTYTALHKVPYPIPFRCLYSRNVDNLMMAGRDISTTHAAFTSTRIMRTGGMMGEVLGMAAKLCKQFSVTPRGVYQQHLEELKQMMKKGVPASEK